MNKYFILMILTAVSLINLHGYYTIEEQSPEAMIVTFHLDNYSIESDDEFTNIAIDYTRYDQPGFPDLPYKVFNLVVPPGGDLEFRILAVKSQDRRLVKPIRPVAEIRETGKTNEFIFNLDPFSYREASKDFFIKRKKFYFRFYELIPLEFHPFVYDHTGMDLQICTEIKLEIKIKGNHNYRKNIPEVYQDTMKDFILNYEQGKDWKRVKEKDYIKIPFSKSEFWYEIVIDKGGVYEIGPEFLQELPDYFDPASLRLMHMLKKEPDLVDYQLVEIPLYILTESNSETDRGYRIFFKIDPEYKIDPHFNHKLWLTFGGRFYDMPVRLSEKPEGDLQEIIEFTRKDISGSSIREDINILMIHPAEFLEQTQELASLHFEHFGLSSHLADQQEIFNVFSGGFPDAEAIKDSIESCFILHPELEYVVLVGSGTSDWNNPSEKNRIMVLNTNNDYLGDDNFVIFNSNNRPEMSISRLPAQNQSDLDFLLDRIRKYIEEPDLGWWRNKILIIPDDENKGGGFEGTSITSGLNHTKQAEDTAKLINKGTYVDKLYTIEYDLDPYQNKPDVTEDLIERINAGRLIWYYLGHGDPDVLGDEEYFKTSQDLGFLTNKDRPTLFLAASCSVGRFDEAAYDCTAEQLLLHREGGSIGSIAATRSCGPDNNVLLMNGILNEMVNVRNNVGKSLFNAILNSGASAYTSILYNLLGHPLLQINPPDHNLMITEIADSLQARQTVEMEGYFSESDLNAENARLKVFDADQYSYYFNQIDNEIYEIGYKKAGQTFFDGLTQVENGYYSGTYVVPDDINDLVEVEPLLDFYYSGINERGFIVEGDITNRVNINYDIRIISPAGEQFTWVYSVDFDGENTTIVLDDSIQDAEYGLENLRAFVDISGRIICYLENNGKEYVSYYSPLIFDSTPVNAENNDAPQIDLMLDSRTYKDGDYVTTTPILIADIEDENGINILGTPGHKILAIIDDDEIRIDVTEGFVYDLNSHTKGVLTWQLPSVEEGAHILQLLVFDNFNTPAFESTEFIARKAGKVSIEKMLPYPNPMQDEGYFTFIITESADITLTLYTLTGRKIRTIKKPLSEAGYNQIYWDGKDQDGDELANNTYFWKIKAKQISNGKISEEIGTFIIFK